MVERTLSECAGPVYSFGPIIHNPQEVARLSALGLTVLDTAEDEWPPLSGVTVVLRAHGVDADTERRLLARGATLVDSTCGTVKQAQDSARVLVADGWQVLLVGSPDHPEVRAITARAGGPVTIVRDGEDALAWLAGMNGEPQRVGVTCQTTVAPQVLEQVLDVLRPQVRELRVNDTICPHMARRWREAGELSRRVSLMVVVGGSQSSNTATLAAVCRGAGVETRMVENERDIRRHWLAGVDTVGVTGGASTPGWLIDRVVERLAALGR